MPRFNIGQLMLLTALAALSMALGTTLYTRARGMFKPETVAYSPDGESMAARYSDGTVIVWNKDGRRLGSFDTREQWLGWSFGSRRIHLLNEQRVLAADEVGQLQVWDVESGKPTRPFGPMGLSPGDSAIGISGDGKRAAISAIATAQPGVEIWDLETQKRVKKMNARISLPVAIALSEDSDQMAVLTHRDGLEVWDVESEARLQGPYSFSSGSYPHDWMFTSSSDLRVAVVVVPGRYDADEGWEIELMGIADGQRAIVHTDHEVLGIRLADDGTRLAALGPEQQVTLLDTSNGDTICKISPPYKQPVFNAVLPNTASPPLAISPDGSEVMIGSNVEVGIYDATTGTLKRRLWHSQESLSKWFFMPGFITWGVLWGIARRRQRQRDKQADKEVVNAEMVDADGESAEVGPPTAMITTWVLLGIGGIAAIVWSLFILFAELSCLVLTPFPYYGLYVGLLTLSSGAGRRMDKLPLIHSAQMLNIICCDPLNLVLAIAGLILSNMPSARVYAAANE